MKCPCNRPLGLLHRHPSQPSRGLRRVGLTSGDPFEAAQRDRSGGVFPGDEEGHGARMGGDSVEDEVWGASISTLDEDARKGHEAGRLQGS
ncbi:hypothetical protein SCP_1104230 [Sparassis crispa]|uniref:Uncharacterized protein n=1 Tax=Sparassis crispa TaxID=139825 RepID=A0A401GZZ1_9APHY|nr:hypothetical protein SCP_1104230 [Sparassis crispa]GBE87746.1 hypothetical protein SCP_1104230 [Sparassis crispa]